MRLPFPLATALLWFLKLPLPLALSPGGSGLEPIESAISENMAYGMGRA